MLFSLFVQHTFAQNETEGCEPCSDLLTYVDSNGHTKPVTGLCEWNIKKRQVIDSMQALFGKLPIVPNIPPFKQSEDEVVFPPFNTNVLDSIETPHYVRYNIQFTVAHNESVLAYLYVPKSINKSKLHPAIVALPPTTGRVLIDTKVPYAKELAERGYVVIGPEYPGIGELKDYNFDDDRYDSGIMKGVFNHIRCIDYLQQLGYVDIERIGVIGHSLGGHSSIFLGVFDSRVKVIVSSVGWTQMEYYKVKNGKERYGSRLGAWAQLLYAPLFKSKYHLNDDRFPFNFDELIGALAPRYFFSNSPIHDSNFNVEGVRVGIANASEVYRLYNAENNIQVRYPIAGHDFPLAIRNEAYCFIDNVLMSPID